MTDSLPGNQPARRAPNYGWIMLGMPFSIIVLLWIFQGVPWVQDQSATGAQAEALTSNTMGEMAMKEKRYEAAFNHFRTAIHIKEDYTEAYVNLGVLYHLIARDSRAKGDTLKAAQLDQEAIATLKKATSFGAKKNEMIYNNLGMVYASIAQFDTAVAMFKRALDFGISPAPIWRNIGEVAMQRGDWRGAAEAYANAIKFRPTMPNMIEEMLKNAYYAPENEDYINTVKESLDKGVDSAEFTRYDAEIVDRYLKSDVKVAGDYKDVGLALEKLGAIEEALNCYQKAVQIKPDWAAIYNRMGIIYARQGNYPQAEREFRRALAADPRDEGARDNLAFLQKKLGNATSEKE